MILILRHLEENEGSVRSVYMVRFGVIWDAIKVDIQKKIKKENAFFQSVWIIHKACYPQTMAQRKGKRTQDKGTG